MSILIRGMEMPKDCLFCPMFHGAWAMCNVLDKTTSAKGRPDDCPLVPVPPHGRLGDLDAAVELAMQYCPDDDGACSKAGFDLRELLDELEGLPTIIPAEEGET